MLVSVGGVLLAPGGTIPAAGYVFTFVAVALMLAAIVLFTVRHPVMGAGVIAALVVLIVAAVLFLDATALVQVLVQTVLPAFLAKLPLFGVTAAHLTLTASLVLWAIGDARPPYGRFAAGVLRHRTAITVTAAAARAAQRRVRPPARPAPARRAP